MKESKVLKRVSHVAVVFCLAVICVAVVKTTGQEENSGGDRAVREQWEYLVVAGPSTTNLSATTTRRKEPDSAFAREAFVLEQHLDNLGSKGWELIAISGAEKDPAFYFKRRKRSASSR
jgi:hypothetical protein